MKIAFFFVPLRPEHFERNLLMPHVNEKHQSNHELTLLFFFFYCKIHLSQDQHRQRSLFLLQEAATHVWENSPCDSLASKSKSTKQRDAFNNPWALTYVHKRHDGKSNVPGRNSSVTWGPFMSSLTSCCHLWSSLCIPPFLFIIELFLSLLCSYLL